jgi:hypothetical protein
MKEAAAGSYCIMSELFFWAKVLKILSSNLYACLLACLQLESITAVIASSYYWEFLFAVFSRLV